MTRLERKPSRAELPAATAKHVTFGCLNNFSKVNANVLALWARGWRPSPALAAAAARPPRHSSAANAGCDGLGLSIDPGRIEFADYRSRDAYLELFRRIDISLDTFPYNGQTTSLDSLWMGVPAVTLIGATVVGRAGFGQLTNLGLPELDGTDPRIVCGDCRGARGRPGASFDFA